MVVIIMSAFVLPTSNIRVDSVCGYHMNIYGIYVKSILC